LAVRLLYAKHHTIEGFLPPIYIYIYIYIYILYEDDPLPCSVDNAVNPS